MTPPVFRCAAGETTDLYPGRDGGLPRLIPRREPVAWRDRSRDSPLNAIDYQRWISDGFLQLHDVFSDAEVSVFRAESERLRDDPGIRALDNAITEKGSGELRSLFAPQRHSELVARLLRHRRLLDITRFLLDSDVYIHQARINFKPGFRGREFWWHSDFETWHAEDGMPRMRAISVSISLTDNTPWNGPLLLMPGSHRWYASCPAPTPPDHFRSSLKEQRVGTPDDASLQRLAERGVTGAIGPAGTVTLFDCNTMHGSPGNITPWPRSNLFFVYNSVHNALLTPYGGQPPRPGFVAERENVSPLRPL